MILEVGVLSGWGIVSSFERNTSDSFAFHFIFWPHNQINPITVMQMQAEHIQLHGEGLARIMMTVIQ